MTGTLLKKGTLRRSLDARDTGRGQAGYGRRWVFDGDSITRNGISVDAAGNQDRRESWTTEMARLANGRINFVYNAGVAGQRTDDALERVDDFVAPYEPDVVLLTVGTNDIGDSRDMDLWLDDLDSYLAKCKSIGADLIVGEIWPTDETSVLPTRGAITRTWNESLWVWGVANDVQIIRWSALADPATGGWPSTWTTDALHPSLVDSYSQIGAFGWASVEPKAGPPDAVRRAVANGADLLTNGFFTTLGSVLGVPTGTSATPSTSAGTLPAGTYSYKVTGRTNFGEGLPPAAFTAVLSGTGQISIAATTPAGGRGVRIYRKGPSDSDWLFLAYVPLASLPYVDNGSVAPGAAITGVDTSAAPTGLTVGTTTNLHEINGPWIFTDPGIRGNVARFRKTITGQTSSDYIWSDVTAGTEYEMSCLLRGSGPGAGGVLIRWRDAVSGGGNALGQVYAYRQQFSSGWGLIHVRGIAPTGALSARVSFELFDATIDYIDVAEVRFAAAA